MTGTVYPARGDRLLVTISPSAVSRMLAEQPGRPVAALLTSHYAAKDPAELDPVILSLLDSGCQYFVCFGVASEALHDRIDELVEGASTADGTVMTTWHDDETAAEVAEFFFNIAAAKERCLLVAVLEPNDSELANLLVQQASA